MEAVPSWRFDCCIFERSDGAVKVKLVGRRIIPPNVDLFLHFCICINLDLHPT